MLLQSPSAAQARNTLAGVGTGILGADKKGDVVNKRELPNAEFQDFLSTYDETFWQRPEEEKKEEDN